MCLILSRLISISCSSLLLVSFFRFLQISLRLFLPSHVEPTLVFLIAFRHDFRRSFRSRGSVTLRPTRRLG
ncbi:hypothetical protein B0H34DRAFT_735899 [Crassisporium funariophilum]|nr:hypothetical protein B0H34DRAFT_735899 [Crassisporium funariophilum]